MGVYGSPEFLEYTKFKPKPAPKCKICGLETDSNYCPNCGAPVKEKITVRRYYVVKTVASILGLALFFAILNLQRAENIILSFFDLSLFFSFGTFVFSGITSIFSLRKERKKAWVKPVLSSSAIILLASIAINFVLYSLNL